LDAFLSFQFLRLKIPKLPLCWSFLLLLLQIFKGRFCPSILSSKELKRKIERPACQ
jgi:hypothetical protein